MPSSPRRFRLQRARVCAVVLIASFVIGMARNAGVVVAMMRQLFKLAFLTWIASVSVAARNVLPQAPAFSCPAAIFNFGDSLSDTGNAAIAFPFTSNVRNAPYGQSYFPHPGGRFSDGRVLIDFVAQAFSFPLLAPYLQSFSPDLRRGANFAYAGATANNDTSFTPFHLLTQVDQFLGFKQRTVNVQSQAGNSTCAFCAGNLPPLTTFNRGLYVIAIGGNDLTSAYFQQKSVVEVMQTIVPNSVNAVVQSTVRLYNSGARSFMIFNVPAEGCSPIFLNDFGGPKAPVDKMGCLTDYNKVVLELNAQMIVAIAGLRIRLADATILHVDYYSANMDVLLNPAAYGMLAGMTMKACCGVGGQYNFNPTVSCGNSGWINGISVVASACSDPKQYVNWDGIHFTEAFYRSVARKILNGSYMDPPINLADTCALTFAMFDDPSFAVSYPGVTFM